MQSLKLYRILIPIGLFMFMLTGCAGMGQRLEAPRVKLATIRVEDFNVLETVFEVRLRVFNTNATALHIKGKVRLGAGALPPVLPFDSEGNISLPDLPQLKKGSQFSKPF